MVLAVAAWVTIRRADPMARCDEHRFDTALWRDSLASSYPRAVRGCIVDDLLSSINLHRRTRPEIVAILGEPPKTGYFKEYDLVYWLGPERSLISIDSEWLVFRLDSLGRVAEFVLLTD